MKHRIRLAAAMLMVVLTVSGCGSGADQLYTEGVKQLEAGQYEAAITSFQKGVETKKRLAENYRGLGIAYYNTGDYASAVTVLKQSLEEMDAVNDAFTIDVYYYLAESYRARGELVRAAEAYTKLLEYTHTAEAYEHRGTVYMEKGDTDRGLQDFEKAVALDDSYSVIWQVYTVCKSYDMEKQGRTFLEQALDTESDASDDAQGCYYRGLFNYTLGYYDQARDVLLQAVNKDSDEARLLLGKVYLAMEDVVSARSVYQEYLSRNAEAAEAYNGLALCDIAEQNYDAALQNIEQGLAKAGEEDKQSLLFNRIVVYEYKLEFEQAKSYMAEYVKTYPDDEEAVRENQFLQTR